MQRFGSKAALVQSTLLHAWDRLDEKTETLAAGWPGVPAARSRLLVALSRDYGDIEAYADGLLVLREDLRDPVLRARGAQWKAALCRALDACFADDAQAPPGIGLLLASQWQGSLLWWSFDPAGKVEDFVAATLHRFIEALLEARPEPAVDGAVDRTTEAGDPIMPAKSAAQQKAAGAALSAKRGDTPKRELKGPSKSMAESMSEAELERMASTKRKGKPEHKTKAD